MNKFYIYPGNYSGIIRDGLVRKGNWVEEEKKEAVFTNCHFIWKPTNISVAGYNKLDGIVRNRPKNFNQVFNHFENVRGICTKTGLIRSLKKYYQRNKEAERADYNVFDSTPTSFIITAGVDDHEHAQFISRFREIERQNFSKERLPQKHCPENFWLVKPANLNQGKGIKVFKSLKDIHAFLNEKEQHSFWVIQKYIEKPLLYFGRKFDIRIWVLVTQKNEIFLYKKAYIRTSSDSYDLNNKNNYVHLTNNCLQQFGDNYGKHEDGNTLPMEILDTLFEKTFPDKNIKLETHIIPRIKDLIIDTIQCTKSDLNPKHRPNIFEFFGYDFMIDEDLRTWLIEVNTNPYLGTPNEYIGKLLPNMVDDLLEMTTDHLFTPKNTVRKDRPNDFELIYCEGNSKYHDGPFSARSSFTANIYPAPDMAPADAAKRLAAAEKRQQLFQAKSLQATSNKFTGSSENPNSKPAVSSSQVMKNQSTVEGEGEKPVVGSKETLEKKEEKDVVVEKEILLGGGDTTDSGDEGEILNKKEPVVQSMEDKLKWSKSHNTSIDVIYKNLHLSSIYKTNLNPTSLAKELNIVLSCLKNWELISEKKSTITCKTLKLIAQSSASYLLLEPQSANTLAELLKSSNVSIDIKLAIVETINFAGKELALKKKIINTKLIHELVRICISSCDEKEIQNYSKLLLVTALKCLIAIGAPFFRKAGTLAEAKDFERVRSSYMAQGALIAAWLVANHSIDLDMREIAFRTFLINIDHKSMEKQLIILELLKIIPEASENEDSDFEEGSKSPEPKEKRLTVADEIVEKKVNEENDLSTINYQRVLQTEGGELSPTRANLKSEFTEAKGLSFPKSLLKIYSLERLQHEFREFLRSLSNVQYNKENEEKDRRILVENERQRKDEQKRQLLIEEARRLHTPKTDQRSKSKLKLMQIQHMYQKYKIDTVGVRIVNQSPEKLTGQTRKRETSIETTKERTGKFIEDLLEKANTEQDNHFSSSKSQTLIENGYKKAGKAQAFKEKAREMKSYRIMSKTNTISAPSLRHKNSLAASLTSAQLGQSKELAVNSDTENGTQGVQGNTAGFRTHYPLKIRHTEKKYRASAEEDEVKIAESEQLFAHELAESLNRKQSQKQLKPLPLNQVDNEAKEQHDATSRGMRKSSQPTKRKNHTPNLQKRTVL